MGKEKQILGNLEELAELAKKLNENKTNWHWHYLPEGCALNYAGKYIALIETEEKDFIVLLNKKPERKTLRKIDELYLNRP